MLLDHAAWPAACLIAGGLYTDGGGRQWAKILGLNAHGLPIGSGRERAAAYAAYAFLIVTGLAGISVGVAELM